MPLACRAKAILAVLDGFTSTADRIRFITLPAGGRRRLHGRGAWQADRAARRVLCDARPRGHQRASIGVHTAFQDSTPMVLFVGDVASDQRDREAFQEVDYGSFFGPSTKGMAKRVERIDDARRIPEYVARAFATAMNGRPGPVVLVLPEDMLTQPVATQPLPACGGRARPGATPVPARPARAAAEGAAPVGHCRRRRLDAAGRAGPAALCRKLAAAGGQRLPLSGHL
jgi:hypothetical protein